MTRLGKQPPRYRFILNPYADERFTSCPECDRPTEERKLPLVIHVDPLNPVSVNKTCCYCPGCDLLIAHRDELETQLEVLFRQHNPDVIGNDYLVLGTLDHDVWDRGRQTPLTIQEMMDNLHDFQEVLRIHPTNKEEKSLQRQRHQGPGQLPRSPGTPQATPAASGRKPGRNDPCWCGSGKKYKNCHLRQDAQ